ncbi:HD domain-containing protein [Rhodococcus xishaensis]|uniref:Phosphohydrolase n=1 Tax=Rhodococcus xishaensis TaxID=2487364 RepID=A0A3S3A9T1_9NOCA|nr:HD domain-containing protein [Rhodococcus xishaensis]RVW03046.1 phosphohydrolase [Rhodococcus xishaensis]
MQPGEKTRGERVRLGARALLNATLEVPRATLGPRVGTDRPLTSAPDTPVCAEADELAKQTLTPIIYEHSRRCWQWACALAEIDEITPDAEALFVACMLHDIELGTTEPGVGCFVTASGAVAAGLCRDAGRPELADLVEPAILRHFDPTPGPAPEQRALHDAAHLDVVGYRLRELTRTFVTRVLDAHPRNGFQQEFLAAMRTEARLRPRSVAATMYRSGLALPLRLNPLDGRGPQG